VWQEARARGKRAIVAIRIDRGEIGDSMSEIAAYATAMTVQPLAPLLPEQAWQLGKVNHRAR
jgi:hypothetical protein